jgi:hypothetical protein
VDVGRDANIRVKLCEGGLSIYRFNYQKKHGGRGEKNVPHLGQLVQWTRKLVKGEKIAFQGPNSAPKNYKQLVIPNDHPSKCLPCLTLLNLLYCGPSNVESGRKINVD